MNADVRIRIGTPTVGDFSSSSGTPIVVNRAAGSESLYILNDENEVVDVSGGSGPGGASWGSITGTLSAQTDLQTALNLKANTASIQVNLASETGGTNVTMKAGSFIRYRTY